MEQTGSLPEDRGGAAVPAGPEAAASLPRRARRAPALDSGLRGGVVGRWQCEQVVLIPRPLTATTKALVPSGPTGAPASETAWLRSVRVGPLQQGALVAMARRTLAAVKAGVVATARPTVEKGAGPCGAAVREVAIGASPNPAGRAALYIITARAGGSLARIAAAAASTPAPGDAATLPSWTATARVVRPVAVAETAVVIAVGRRLVARTRGALTTSAAALRATEEPIPSVRVQNVPDPLVRRRRNDAPAALREKGARETAATAIEIPGILQEVHGVRALRLPRAGQQLSSTVVATPDRPGHRRSRRTAVAPSPAVSTVLPLPATDSGALLIPSKQPHLPAYRRPRTNQCVSWGA